MRVEDPRCLWLLPAVAVLGAGLWAYCRREVRRRLGLFLGGRQKEGPGLLKRKRLRLAVMVAALLLLCLSLAQPLAGLKSEAAKRQGVNALIALDASSSMLTQDVAPSRFGLAQKGIASLVDSFDGDRAGLMMFGGQATLVSPMTFDTISLQLIANGLTTELVGKGGTSLADVIGKAAAYFHGKPYKTKVLILFTDGEETEGDAVIAAQAAARKEGLKILTIGVGTERGGPIPLMQRNDQLEWVRVGSIRDSSGKEVVSRMDPKLLREVAEISGGAYVDLSAAKGDLKPFYEQYLRPLAAPLEAAELKDLKEWFQVPLALALMLLAWGWLMEGRPAPPSGGARPASKPMPPAAVGLLALLAATSLHASVSSARKLMAKHDYDGAFTVLQNDLLLTPDDPYAKYDYALAAYADGKFDVAIAAFEKLTGVYEPDVANKSAFQLGNSLYRQGEVMRADNPEGTVALWEKAAGAYSKAPGEAALHNFNKTHADLLTLLDEMAGTKEAAGDEAARVSPDKGIPSWRDAVGYLDQALKLSPNEDQGRKIADHKEEIIGKMFDAYFRSAEDRVRRAELQKDAALEMAIGLLKDAIGNYDEALALHPDDVPSKEGKARAGALLEPWLVELGYKQHEEGVKAKPVSLDDALGHWQQAASTYQEVLDKNPKNTDALSGQQENNRSLHDGHVEKGDQDQQKAADPTMGPDARDPLLEDALGHYQVALAIEPHNAATKAKLMRLGLKMVGMFVARGQKELGAGKQLADAATAITGTDEDSRKKRTNTISEAISYLERSVESFGHALGFDPVNDPAKKGKKEAEDLLRRLRNQEQRKVLGHDKEIKNPEELKDAGKLALKLIEYNTDRLASKKQQNYTLPENKPLKDW